MKMTAKNSFIFSIIVFCLLSSWAGPFPSGDGERAQKHRFPPHAVVSGQVLLDSGGFVGGLFGSPPPPRITGFPASVRIYLCKTNQLVRTVLTDSEGRFEIRLIPADYRIVPDIMQDGHVVAPGDAQGVIIIGPYEVAPALELSVKPNHNLNVTILYRMLMGS